LISHSSVFKFTICNLQFAMIFYFSILSGPDVASFLLHALSIAPAKCTTRDDYSVFYPDETPSDGTDGDASDGVFASSTGGAECSGGVSETAGFSTGGGGAACAVAGAGSTTGEGGAGGASFALKNASNSPNE
jgi:hypothetical protein